VSRPLFHGSVWALLAALVLALPVTAQDKPSTAAATPTPDPKVEQKQKDLKKALDDIDKEYKAKKQDPGEAQNFFRLLIDMGQLEVSVAKDVYKKVVNKKVPFGDASRGANLTYVACIDKKTQKYDSKKFVTDFGKWVDSWKPVDPKAPPAGGGTPAK